MFEISTPQGLAYFQYVYHDTDLGELIRILPRVHAARPSEIDRLTQERESFYTFFPLKAAVRQRIVRHVGSSDVPEHVRKPPIMRAPGRVNAATKQVETWWLWDGSSSWCVNSLDEEQKQYSIKAIWNDTLLIERIVQGWRPADYG